MARQFCETRQNDTNNTQTLKDATQAQTQAILGKLDSTENSAMQDKITALTAQNNALTTQINLSNQNAITAQTVAQAVSPLSTQLGVLTAKMTAMECKQPDTVTTQYSPFTVVPNFPPYGAGYLDIKVDVDGITRDFPSVPGSASVFSYNNGTVVISENQIGLENEIRGKLNHIDSLLDYIEDYKKDKILYEELLIEVSPAFAKDSERDKRLITLNDKVLGMESKLDKVLELISKEK